MGELSNYEIQRELGRGAMGTVHLARDTESGRDVALKELKLGEGLPDVRRTELVERFLREAEAAAKLDDPHVVRIFSSFSEEDRHFIAMEYLEGETLDAVLMRGPLPPDASSAVAAQVLKALGAAHDAGIVHRDLKPENVFVLNDGTVKVADFGVAHVDDGPSLTRHGEVLGTLGYMSPEQVKGEPVDARSDVFAVGVILYEMLIGANPFHADQPTTVMYRIAYDEPPPPDPFVPGLPGHVGAVIKKAMAKDPALRYLSAAEMLQDLEAGKTPDVAAIEAAAAVRAAAPSKPAEQKTPSSISRRTVVVGALAAVLALGGAIGGYAVYKSREAERVARQVAIVAEGRQMAQVVSRLKGDRAELSSVVASLKAKGPANARALAKRDQEWKRRQAAYDSRCAVVSSHNASEDRKKADSAYTTYWWFTAYTYYSYTPSYWTYPSPPRQPAKAKVDVSSESRRLAELESEINGLRSELTTLTTSARFFGVVYQSVGTAAQALGETVGDARAAMTGIVSRNPEKGDVINLGRLSVVNLGGLDAPFHSIDQQVSIYLDKFDVTLEQLRPVETTRTTRTSDLDE